MPKEKLLQLLEGRGWRAIVCKAHKLSLSRSLLVYRFGRHHSPETRLKISLAKIGRVMPEETKHKISATEKGRRRPPFSEETRRKMSLWQQGRKLPPFTDQHRQRMSEAQQKLFSNPIYRAKAIERSRRGLFKKPNKAEKRLDQILQQAFSGEWRYVGDGQVLLAGYCPDFINCNGKKQIIELFGRKFHDPSVTFLKEVQYCHREENRREIFKGFGYDMLVIWDDELQDEEAIISKVKTFAV